MCPVCLHLKHLRLQRSLTFSLALWLTKAQFSSLGNGETTLDKFHRNLLIRSLDAKDQGLECDRQSTENYATNRFIVQRFSNRL
ncbi:hypothetical protein T11_5286 [Trichinella zimbabwensis]|uniref:Secreted protein n=1 Tax=Trichinella zimbabwensis TaxID=268475 RepID=A0A0V1H7E6_9BILA|nr:hypothetical protein T11_5286 [Trichinella zimbabwensis]